MRLILLICVVLISTACSSNTVYAHSKRVYLGERVVNDAAEYDQVIIGRKRGAFASLQLEVKGAATEFKRVVITYANGEKQVFRNHYLIRAGGQSPRIQLRGNDRYLSKVEFYYETRTRGYEKALVKLYAYR